MKAKLVKIGKQTDINKYIESDVDKHLSFRLDLLIKKNTPNKVNSRSSDYSLL